MSVVSGNIFVIPPQRNGWKGQLVTSKCRTSLNFKYSLKKSKRYFWRKWTICDYHSFILSNHLYWLSIAKQVWLMNNWDKFVGFHAIVKVTWEVAVLAFRTFHYRIWLQTSIGTNLKWNTNSLRYFYPATVSYTRKGQRDNIFLRY